MPTILRVGPYRFFFYSGDRDEPRHVHVERDDRIAKFWLDPVRLQRSGGFSRADIRQIHGIIKDNQLELMEAWMTASAIDLKVPDAVDVLVTEDTLSVELNDGRIISVPLEWYPRLVQGSPEEREEWRLIGRGHGIHWEKLEEDVSVEGLLAGKPSGESQVSFEKWLTERRSRLTDRAK